MEAETLFTSLAWLVKSIPTGPDFLSEQALLVLSLDSLYFRFTNFLRFVMDQNLPLQEEAEVRQKSRLRLHMGGGMLKFT